MTKTLRRTAPRRRTTWYARNPVARSTDRRQARAIAEDLARSYAKRGARCVVLGGSWARGDAHRASDIDLWVFGLPTAPSVLWHDPFMVTLRRTTEAAEARRLRCPPELGGCVPGWRVAVALHDPEGIARRLQRAARAFRWEDVSDRCDRWVADQTVGWAEEAIKLVRALGQGEWATAAVQRDLLAEHLGFVMAIHRRTFWDSENHFWERISRQVGGRWAAAQRAALGIPSATLEQSCHASLELYAETTRAVWGTLGPEARTIATHTCEVAGVPLGPARSR